MKQQKGYLLVSALVLIVIVGLLAATISYLVVTESTSALHQSEVTKTLYIGRAGLERVLYPLLRIDFSDDNDRMLCSTITGNPNFTQIAFGAGFFTAQATHYAPDSFSTLSDSINATATVIPVDSIAPYPDYGYVLIDKEFIKYGKTSTDGDFCDEAPPCLLEVTRGVNGTVAISHSTNTPVSQNQCDILVESATPDFTNPLAKHKLSAVLPLEDGWMVGTPAASDANVGHWNAAYWQQGATNVSNVILRGLDVLSHSDVWAVGDSDGTSGLMLHWNGSAWVRYISGVPNVNLQSVSCVNHNDCWAVGDKLSGNIVALHWNGSAWSYNTGTLPTIAVDENLHSVTCLSSNNCLAVGDSILSGYPNILRWNGSQWASAIDDENDVNLYAVACSPSGNICLVVGADGQRSLYQCTSSTCTASAHDASVPNTVDYRGVACVNDNNCWAVGSNNVIHWNGSQWSLYATIAGLSGNLMDVSCVTDDHCWAVTDAGALVHFDGSNWLSWSTTQTLPSQIYGIRMMHMKLQRPFPVKEVF